MHAQPQARRNRQAGGITILVALMLLVLLTIAAVGMSRNSFRDVVLSGTSRQGALVRNTADSGIEWGIFWIYPANSTTPTPTATAFQNLENTLRNNLTMAGKPYDPTTGGLYNTANPPTPPADLTLPAIGNTTLGYSVALTSMGKLPVTDVFQGTRQGTNMSAAGQPMKAAPDLWAVRSDAQVTVGTGITAPTFVHAKEAFVSTVVH